MYSKKYSSSSSYYNNQCCCKCQINYERKYSKNLSSFLRYHFLEFLSTKLKVNKVTFQCNGLKTKRFEESRCLKFYEKFNKKGVGVFVPTIYKSFEPRICLMDHVTIELDQWSRLASNVIYAGPHGKSFDKGLPIILKVPICVSVERDDIVEIYTSNTDVYEPLHWEILQCNYNIRKNYVYFQTSHFSFFTIVVRKRRPYSEKLIKQNCGGQLVVRSPEGPTAVHFPEYSITETEFMASMETLYYDPFYLSSSENKLLAAPIISLQPSGTSFRKKVCVTMPLPKGHHIEKFFGRKVELRFRYSQTGINKKPDWKEFFPSYTINWEKSTVQFYVQHFTLFSVFWNILDVAIPEHMKLHASQHLPHFTFWMYCQALMTKWDMEEFGLCILCRRLGSTSTDNLYAQYPINVGRCNPKKIKSGKLTIKLMSGLFQANNIVGENINLEQTVDFNGNDVDVHFACRFNQSVKHIGVFGKVDVLSSGLQQFSFNLIKNGVSTNQCLGEQRVSIDSSMLGEQRVYIDSDSLDQLKERISSNKDMVTEFALALNYNRYEINQKFINQSNPLQEIFADFLSSGGTPEQFSNAIRRTAIIFKLLPSTTCHDERIRTVREEHDLQYSKIGTGPFDTLSRNLVYSVVRQLH